MLSSVMAKDPASFLQVPRDIAVLLHRVKSDWVPIPFPARTPSRLQWGDDDLSLAVRKASIVANRLEIEVRVPEYIGGPDRPYGALAGKKIVCTCDDGTVFQSDSGLAARWSTLAAPDPSDAPGGHASKVWISAHNWTVSNPNKPAILWTCRLPQLELRGLGNLNLSAPLSGSWGHYCLQGAEYKYYLLQRRGRQTDSVLAVETCGYLIPDIRILYREITALGFAMGKPISVPQLYGLDLAGSTVGAAGAEFGWAAAHDVNAAPLVPEMDFEPWTEPFFEALAGRPDEGMIPLPEVFHLE